MGLFQVRESVTSLKGARLNLGKRISVPLFSFCNNPYVKQLVTEITAQKYIMITFKPFRSLTNKCTFYFKNTLKFTLKYT